MSRSLLGIMLGILASTALSGPQATSAASPVIRVMPARPTPGEHLTVRGSDFCGPPCSQVTVAVDGAVAAGGVAVTTDGTFEVVVGLTPASGTSTVTATQTDARGARREAMAIVQVVASDQTNPRPTQPAGTTDGGTTPQGVSWWLVSLGVLVATTVAAAALTTWMRRRRIGIGD